MSQPTGSLGTPASRLGNLGLGWRYVGGGGGIELQAPASVVMVDPPFFEPAPSSETFAPRFSTGQLGTPYSSPGDLGSGWAFGDPLPTALPGIPQPTGVLGTAASQPGNFGVGRPFIAVVIATDTEPDSAETGHAVDTGVAFQSQASTDAGSGTETGRAWIPGTDSGSGVDSGLLKGAFISGIEAGAGAEAGSLLLRSLDAGSGADEAIMLVKAVDSAAGVDGGELVYAEMRGSETSTGVETSRVVLASDDSGTGVESPSWTGPVAPASVWMTGGLDVYRTSQLGTHFSYPGGVAWQLNVSNLPLEPPVDPLLSIAQAYLWWPTMGRIYQAPMEVAVLPTPSPVRATQVMMEAIVEAPEPPARLNQFVLEVAEATAPQAILGQFAVEVVEAEAPRALLGQFSVEVAERSGFAMTQLGQFTVETLTSGGPPPVAIGQFAIEALIKASVYLEAPSGAVLKVTHTDLIGTAYVRMRANELEVQAPAGAILVGDSFLPPLPVDPIPNPTMAPVVTPVYGAGGTLAPGVYAVGYTWVNQYGETMLSPLTLVTVGGSGNASLSIAVPTLPDGVIGYHLYISPVDEPAEPPVQWLEPDPTGETPGTDVLTAPTTEVKAIVSLDRGGRGFHPPRVNGTGTTTRAFDHDFRDPNSRLTAPGPLGWHPADDTARIIVVRSGERDLTQIADETTEPFPPDGTGTWVFNQYPPVESPFEHVLVADDAGAPADDPTPMQELGVGSIPPGSYWIGFTWLNAAGEETTLSTVYFDNGFIVRKAMLTVPPGETARWNFQLPTPQAYAEPPVAANIYVSSYPEPTPLEMLEFSQYSPPLETFVRQNATPIANDVDGGILIDHTALFTLSDLVTSGPNPPANSNWTTAIAPQDGTGHNWWDAAYETVDTTDVHGEEWHRPFGGFPRGLRFQGQDQGIALYDPHWRSLPSAPILADLARIVEPDDRHIAPSIGGIPAGFGPRTYFRHIWTQPKPATEDALLTLRWNGTLSELYVNDTPILGTMAGDTPVLSVGPRPPRYWQTQSFRVPQGAFLVGRNVLAFKIHTSDAADYGQYGDVARIANGDPNGTGAAGAMVHVLSHDRLSDIDRIQLAAGPTRLALWALRPDGSSRMYWTGKFTTAGAGFDPTPGVVWYYPYPQRPGTDDGPGYWGYYGWTHQPEFFVRATWDSGPFGPSPSGERGVFGPGGPMRWPPMDDGFGIPEGDGAPMLPDGTYRDIYRSPMWSLAIGDLTWKIMADRFNMISVGRIFGGGWVQLGAHIPGTAAGAIEGLELSGSREWAPGACFLMTVPTQAGTDDGTVPYTERTAWNALVPIHPTHPIDADTFGHSPTYQYPPGFTPWNRGVIVARLPVRGLLQVFISAVSRRPDGGNLGKARMKVVWLDANGNVGGDLVYDDEFLHAAFGRQPATLHPYSENHFWVGDYFGSGDWRDAAAIEVRMFNHIDNYHSDPNGLTKGNDWLINITVREKVLPATVKSTYVSAIG